LTTSKAEPVIHDMTGSVRTRLKWSRRPRSGRGLELFPTAPDRPVQSD
jgi:hypothetical protein